MNTVAMMEYPERKSCRRFGDLRGVRWRIGLGILPTDPFSPLDDLRRFSANSRRRYASLRRRLLVDPHLPKDGNNSPDRVMDNPLSQNPDSMWGRFFRNAELERMVDQDLSRLYPEHGSYFQTMGCQSTLRRILLLWCLKHPECGYRQGMHELLAPLLYVLHADVEHLSQVRKLYEDHFVDKFDDFPFEENDLSYNFDFKKFSESRKEGTDFENCLLKSTSGNELDPEVQNIVLLSDAYGAEGELGVVISDKFLEHDAYCMFDALMNGSGGAVKMAEFFSPYPLVNSHTGLPPVIEASSALYHLLSIVDSSIHSHLIQLGVEPQYFALRWLRVLFGREFSLEDLVIIWDEIFSCDNSKVDKCADDSGSSFAVLGSLRGAFISAFAVSMILFLRSSILATENATSCLQRLLNFPENVDLKKLLAKTKSLQALALDANNSTPLPLHNEIYETNKPIITRGHTLSLESVSVSPRTPLSLVPESYWEEKWRDLHREEKLKQSNSEKQITNRKKGWSEKVRSSLSRGHTLSLESVSVSPRTPLSLVPESYWEEKWRDLHREEKLKQSNSEKQITNRKKGWSEKVRSSLSRAESAPSSSKVKKDSKINVRRSLLEDLSKQLGIDEETEKTEHIEDFVQQNSPQEDIEEHRDSDKEISYVNEDKNLLYSDEERCSNGSVRSEENSFCSSDSPGHNHLDSSSEKSSVGSNSTIIVKNVDCEIAELGGKPIEDLSLPVSDPLEVPLDAEVKNTFEGKREELDSSRDSLLKPESILRDKKNLSGKFQWFWRFGRNNGGEGSSEKVGSENIKPFNGVISDQNNNNDAPVILALNGSSNSSMVKGESADQNMMVSLKNLGQSMLDNIQVIESVFQQERGQVATLENFSKNALVGKGQVTAMSALKELRKISNLLSEM